MTTEDPATTALDHARTAAGVLTTRLSGGVTAYRVHGDHGPWVVLVHGLVTPMYAWQLLADALAHAGFRVLRYDQLGRGLSDRPAVRYDLDLYVRQLDELTRALHIERAHFVGWSIGSVITSRFALASPDRVEKHVLIAPGMFIEPPLLVRALAHAPFGPKILASRAAAFIDALPAQHMSRPERFPMYVEGMREQLRYPGLAESFASTILNYPWRSGPEFRPVGEHPRPTLLIWGDADPATPYANVRRVRAVFPRAELLRFPGARHAPHVERPREVNDAITRFLAAEPATDDAGPAAAAL